MDSGYASTVKYRKCPSCGTEVLSTMQFCVSCGTRMSNRSCPHCNESIAGNPEFCRNCGKSLIPSRKCPKCNLPISGTPEFCRNCGAPLLDSRTCPSCGAILRRNAKFCNGCGRVMGQESPAGNDALLVEKAQELLSMVNRFGAMPDPPNPDMTTYNSTTLKKTISSLEKFLQTATPDLTITLDRMSLAPGCWHKMEIQLTKYRKSPRFFCHPYLFK